MYKTHTLDSDFSYPRTDQSCRLVKTNQIKTDQKIQQYPYSDVDFDFEFLLCRLYSKKNVSCCLIFAACQLGLNAFLSGYRHISQLSHNGPSIFHMHKKSLAKNMENETIEFIKVIKGEI